MQLPKFITIQGCPVHPDIGAYIAVLVNDANANVVSIYRGDDARPILNKHGHHSQVQIFDATPAERAAWGILGTPNRPGESTHELKSDAVAYKKIPLGQDLEWWMQGFDVDDADVVRVFAQANRRGWHVWQPYKSGAEHHHLNFLDKPTRPKPGSLMWARLWRIRLTYPRS